MLGKAEDERLPAAKAAGVGGFVGGRVASVAGREF